MVQKIFIVALDNEDDHRSLQRALSGEPNVIVIYDRRRGGGDIPGKDRRIRTDVDEQLRTRGWAVVRSRPSTNGNGHGYGGNGYGYGRVF